MTRDEAVACLRRMLTVWPNADLPDDSTAYWLRLLEKSSVPVARQALDLVAGECKFFPSIAEWQDAARRAHQQQRIAAPSQPAIAAPAPNRERMAALLHDAAGTLRAELRGQVIVAIDLDTAGVPDWRERLYAAREHDQRHPSAAEFDRVWAQVKAEWQAAGSPRAPRGHRHARVAGAETEHAPRNQRPSDRYVPSYDEVYEPVSPDDERGRG